MELRLMGCAWSTVRESYLDYFPESADWIQRARDNVARHWCLADVFMLMLSW